MVNLYYISALDVTGKNAEIHINDKQRKEDSAIIVEGARCKAPEAPLPVHAKNQIFRSDDGKFSHNVGRMARIHRCLPEGRQGAGLEDGHTAGLSL